MICLYMFLQEKWAPKKEINTRIIFSGAGLLDKKQTTNKQTNKETSQ